MITLDNNLVKKIKDLFYILYFYSGITNFKSDNYEKNKVTL